MRCGEPGKGVAVAIVASRARRPRLLTPPGTAASGLKVLVNDMNLRLSRTSPAATWYPWKWDMSYQAPSDALTTGDNDRDNVEQVIVPSPATNGILNVKIKQRAGTSLSGGSQWVSVILSGVRTDTGSTETTVTQSMYYNAGTNTETAVLTFDTVPGGYYKIQGKPSAWHATWKNFQDVSGVFYARSNTMTATSDPAYYNMYSNIFPLAYRVVSVAPNPFSLP